MSLPELRITVIGTSGSGKTTFSAGVYAQCMSKTFNNFKIWDATNSDSNVSKFRKRYRTLYTERKFPGQNMEREKKDYRFKLLYRNRKIVNFSWIDYRGELLDDPETDPEKADEIYQWIEDSDAVLLFVDGEVIAHTEDLGEAAIASGADAVRDILSGYSIKNPGARLTFLIVITKVDAVDQHWRENNYQRLEEKTESIFASLFEEIDDEPWQGGIVAVSTIGEGVTVENETVTGPLNPFHIEDAMSFVLCQALKNQQRILLEDLAERSEQSKGSFWGRLGKVLNSDEEENEQLQALNKIQEPIETLCRLAHRSVKVLK